MASSSLSHSPFVEVKLKVAPEIMNHPLGFVIDAGGTLIKLVYRSKEDYKDGKPLRPTDHGVLRLKSFPIDDLPGLEDFIEANVDMALSADHEGVVWWMVGVGCITFKSAWEKKFNIRTKLFPEFIAITNSIKNLEKINLSVYPTHLESIEKAAKLDENLLFALQSALKRNETSNSASPADNYLSQLVATKDVQGWADKYYKHTSPIEIPAAFLLFGSCGGIYKFGVERELIDLELLPFCGKTISGLFEEMFGEKDFEKVIQFVEKGDSRKVDMCWIDIKCNETEKTDWYELNDHINSFQLGKMSSNNTNRKGNYSKEDVAAGVMSFMLNNVAKIVILYAMLHKLDRVYAVGSIFKVPYIRKVLEKHVIHNSLQPFLEIGKPLKIHFFENPGYLVGLGVWLQNVEEEKGRSSNSNN